MLLASLERRELELSVVRSMVLEFVCILLGANNTLCFLGSEKMHSAGPGVLGIICILAHTCFGFMWCLAVGCAVLERI